MFRAILAAGAFAALAIPASAQMNADNNKTFDVKTMNFDLWCQEQAMLPPERCDQRTPEDEEQFEAFRAKIEKYELPYLQDKQREFNFDRYVLDRDPVDNPTDKQSAQPTGTPSPTSATPNP
jgi:hypothetical protein